MMQAWSRNTSFLFFAFSLLVCNLANTGGIMIYDFGPPDVGLASAGYAARAQDASTVFTNPAGIFPNS